MKQEFSALYDLKIMIFLEEIFSVLTTPFILWFSLPKCSDKIIEFFRLFTVHVDGIGYVCSQAVFDFERDGKVIPFISHFLTLSRTVIDDDSLDPLFAITKWNNLL